jgi:hypothetical protein
MGKETTMKYQATFTFVSDTPIHKAVVGLLACFDNYEYVKDMENGGEPFEMSYTFEEQYEFNTIAIGNGYVDSEEAEDY